MSLHMISSDGPPKPVSAVPRFQFFQAFRSNLSDQDYARIKDEMNREIDKVVDTDQEILCSSWIPGSDWTGTEYEPIYYAAGQDQDVARKLYGLLCFETFMEREEDWSCARYPRSEDEIVGLTYFRIRRE